MEEDGVNFSCVDIQGSVYLWKYWTSEKTQWWRSRLVIAHSQEEITATTMEVKAEEGTSVSVKNNY